jgi:phosphoglycolate phosphatase
VTLLVLWDIDGTLLSTARAGVFALEDAARELLGRDVDLQALPTAGLTDAAIAERVLTTHGDAGGPERVERFLRVYEAALPDRLPLRQGRVLDGVRPALDALAARDDAVNALLTGNVEGGAWAKLRHYGLDGYFERGAFCRLDVERAAIARRARALGDGPMVVIGDTPHDVACGKAIDARTLAVASGGTSLAELAACEPWRAIERLPPPDELLALLELE